MRQIRQMSEQAWWIRLVRQARQCEGIADFQDDVVDPRVPESVPLCMSASALAKVTLPLLVKKIRIT